MSHWQAANGAAALERAFHKLDAVQMHRLQSAVVLKQADQLVRQLSAKEDK